MRIELDVSQHCIETDIKRIYNRALSDYFKAASQRRKTIEPVIELTQTALNTWNFNRLRNTHRPLAGGTEAEVVLSETDRVVEIVIDGQTVESIPLAEKDQPGLG